MKRYTSITLSAAMIALFSITADAQAILPKAANSALSFVMGKNSTIENTQLPFEKQAPNIEVKASPTANNGSVLQKASKSTRSLAINDSETWGEWKYLCSGTYQHGDADLLLPGGEATFKTNIYYRESTVSGHDNICQLKVEKAFGEKYDAIFWWDRNENVSWNELTGEPIAASYTFEGYAYSFNSIAFSDASFNPYGGEMIFRTWYSLYGVDNDVTGFAVYDYIVIDDMPDYSMEVSTSKSVCDPEDYSVTVNIDHSDNIGSVRYYVVGEIDDNFTGTPIILTETQFANCPYSTVDSNTKSFDVPISGYQRNRIYVQFLNTDGHPVQFVQTVVFSTQENGRTWESIGYGEYADQYLQKMFNENVTAPEKWKVLIQQCTDEKNYYRLVNPYTNDECPYRKMNLIAKYASDYDLVCDRDKNYYIYFKVQDNMLEQGYPIVSYSYPSGLYLKSKAEGNLSAVSAEKFTVVREDNMIGSESNTFTYPGYTDYSFTLNYLAENVMQVERAAEGTDVKYYIEDCYGDVLVSVTDLPTDNIIDLNKASLDPSTDYKLTVMSLNIDGNIRNKETIFFNLSMTNWQFVGSGSYDYEQYASFTGNHDLYRRYEIKNPNHEQYRIDNWGYLNDANFVINIPDITARIDEGQIPVYITPIDSKIDDVNSDAYGTIYVSDVYNYTGKDDFKNKSYFAPNLGEFQLYLVYYVSKGYFAFGYEEFKLDGYPYVKLIDNNLTMTDNNEYQQSTIINVQNVAYAKYYLYNGSDYAESDALSNIIGNGEATRITQPTTVNTTTPGTYILTLAAYNETDQPIITQAFSFTVPEVVNFNDWNYLGKSTITDGWVVPYLIDDNDSNTNHTWQVDTYTRADKPSVIGLLNPYSTKDFPFISDNMNNVADAMITIDVTDTEMILIPEQYSGFKDPYIGSLRLGNYEGYIYNATHSKDLTISIMDQYSSERTTMSSDNTITVPNCLFGRDGSVFGLSWNNQQTGTIKLPESFVGVNDIIINNNDDTNNAPVEYYNLQGIRVTNPEHGIYIRRQGTHATKVSR